MILRTWGDFSTQIQYTKVRIKRGIIGFAISMPQTSCEQEYRPLTPYHWALVLFIFGETFLYWWVLVEKDLTGWKILTILMQPCDYEAGKGFLNTFSYWLLDELIQHVLSGLYIS